MTSPTANPENVVEDYRVLALYQFVEIADPVALRDALSAEAERLGIVGTLLLADEGLNGTVVGADDAIDALLDWLAADGRFDRLTTNESRTGELPFRRLKVKLRKEIVSLGVPGIAPAQKTGTHVPPQHWNALVDDPDVLLIDTRNDYEIEIGTFAGARSPHTTNFRDFPAWVAEHLDPRETPRVAMFCTGGIRCEKATAFMLEQGFAEVYQLEGGILRYLAEVPEGASRWQGDCFVFDERVSVTHGLARGDYTQCHACRRPLSAEDMRDARYVAGVACPRCHDETDPAQRRRFRERRRQVRLAQGRNAEHLGPAAARSVADGANAPVTADSRPDDSLVVDAASSGTPDVAAPSTGAPSVDASSASTRATK